MGLTLKLLGPDLPSEYTIQVELGSTITQVKEAARQNWPAGTLAQLTRCQRSSLDAA